MRNTKKKANGLNSSVRSVGTAHKQPYWVYVSNKPFVGPAGILFIIAIVAYTLMSTLGAVFGYE